jgi:hypothetical protein
MKGIGAVFVTAALLIRPSAGTAQEPNGHPDLFASGISFTSGIGRYSVRDDFISGRRYTGNVPYVRVDWIRFRENRGFRLGLRFRANGDVKNYNLSSTVTSARLGLDFFYRAGSFRLLGRSSAVYLGPSTGITLYVSDQNIAGNGLDLAISFAGLLSVGGAAGLVVPLSDKLSTSAGLRADLLSLGLRIVDLVESDESPVKVLTAPRGTDLCARVGLRYDLHRRFSAGIGYEAQMTRVSAWDYLGIGSDNLVLTLTVGF